MSKAGERRRSSRRRISAKSATNSKRSGRSLWINSPSTVEDLHQWPLQEAKERRIQRNSLKTCWLEGKRCLS
ncbi:unnamed protein product [Victoria cruziana]